MTDRDEIRPLLSEVHNAINAPPTPDDAIENLLSARKSLWELEEHWDDMSHDTRQGRLGEAQTHLEKVFEYGDEWGERQKFRKLVEVDEKISELLNQ